MVKLKCLVSFAGANISMYAGEERIVGDKAINIEDLEKAGYIEVLEETPTEEPKETTEEIPTEEVTETAEETPVDFKSLKKDELVALAAEKGIEVPAKATKDELIQLVSTNEN